MLALTVNAQATQQARPVRVAVLDFGETETARRSAERVAAALLSWRAEKPEGQLSLVDRDLSRAAARGAGYAGSLNLTLGEARDLGAAIDCDFYITGDAQTIRRSSADTPVYYEAYASLFLVSARTGRLISWERPNATAATPEQATAALVSELDKLARTQLPARILEAQVNEANERRARASQAEEEASVPLADLSGEESAPEQGNLRTPLPYRRISPPYPDTAARADAEATVDVLVDIGADGEVSRVEIARWGGFGLDEAVVTTVRRMRFRSALRDGTPVPARFILRYNFRRSPKTTPAN